MFCRKSYWKKQPFIFIWWTRFSDICTIIELKELNWLCKHTKNVKSSQPCIQWIFVLNQVKHKFFHVSIVNRLYKQEFAGVSKEASPIVYPRTSASNILNRSGKSICQLVQKLGEKKKNIKRYTLQTQKFAKYLEASVFSYLTFVQPEHCLN